MKILVYGAGVLGSYLAHELHHGEHRVTILARGKRYESLKENGLTIEHIRQKSETTDHIAVTDRLNAEDDYDIIFVVMQKSQLPDVLPVLEANTAVKTIIFMGNNTEADVTYREFTKRSKGKPKVLFGFLSCGGYRKNEKVYNWHGKKCDITIGPVQKDSLSKEDTETIFRGTNLTPDIKPDMNAWLKYHSALITPICIAIQYEGEKSRRMYHSEALRLAVDAVKESIHMFETQGFLKDAPHDMKMLRWSTGMLKFLVALILSTKTGYVVAAAHALNAVDEVELLRQELQSCAMNYRYPLVSLTKLCEYTMN